MSSDEPPRCFVCDQPVSDWALDYARRMGVYRCRGTYCQQSSGVLLTALRTMTPRPVPLETDRIALLERTLRQHGIEVP